MPYVVVYRNNNGPEEMIEFDSLPDTDYERRLLIQSTIDAGIIVNGTSIEKWNEAHAREIEIIDVRQNP